VTQRIVFSSLPLSISSIEIKIIYLYPKSSYINKIRQYLLTEKHLHIITLDIPFPPDYGGMIDTYNRIRILHELGISIHLHCFEYGRLHPKELTEICDTIYYYKRRPSLLSIWSSVPGIIKSRNSNKLLIALMGDRHPILFDGLHTTFLLNNPALSDRKKIVRAHNIEHEYYFNLARLETNIFKKLHFYVESVRLKRYEKVLVNADFVVPVSDTDFSYFSEKYNNAIQIRPFHPFKNVESIPGSGNYIIYHGNLSIKENEAVVERLVRNVFSQVDIKFIIAGRGPSSNLINLVKRFPSIRIIPNPDNYTINDLIKNAHIQLMLSATTHGFKVKPLIAVFSGRHCVVNSNMIHGTGLEEICIVLNSEDELATRLKDLMDKEFTTEMIKKRKIFLSGIYNITENGKRLVDLIFNK
jgi:hypothetical protein